jgi:hypothetical protein
MSKRVYLAIDNGTSGTICLMDNDGEVIFFIKTPKLIEQSYTKKKGNISRIDSVKLKEIFVKNITHDMSVMAFIERPMVNPTLFKTSLSAVRALEATLVILEDLRISRQYIDSKKWQHELLPTGTKGSVELKKASRDIAIRLFPQFTELITKHKDGDALLIATWARRVSW